jgi:hypothetical protein
MKFKQSLKNYRRYSALLVLLLFFAFIPLALSGCGGGGSGSGSLQSSITLSGNASDGPISGGTVKVYALNSDGSTGNLLATTTTDSSGNYTANIGSYSGNVIVEISGGTYTDEATGKTQTNTLMRAVVTGVTGSVSVAVTPLTEVAAEYAEAKGGLTSANIDAGNDIVSDIVGLNIISTNPANTTSVNSSTSSAEAIDYGLELAAISQMVESGQATSPANALTQITYDLVNNGYLKTTGAGLNESLVSYCGGTYNETGITDCSKTMLYNSVAFLTANPINPDVSGSDLDNAKGLITDTRNTALSIYNYQGYGLPGIVNTSLTNVISSMQLQTFGADMINQGSITLLVLGYLVENYSAGSLISSVTGGAISTSFNGYSLMETSSTSNSFTFNIYYQSQTGPVLEGTATLSNVIYDQNKNPISGTISISSDTANPNSPATSSFNFSAPTNNGLYTALTLTGSMANSYDGVSADFSQSGRGLSITFGQLNGGTSIADTYITSISFTGEAIINKLVQFDGTLSIPTFENTTAGIPLPTGVNLSGTLQPLNSSNSPSGTKFVGTLNVSSSNIGSINLEDYFTNGGSSANFLKFNGTFTGTISAPSMPTITATIGASCSTYQQYDLLFSYKRTNTDGSVVSLSGSGTYDASTNLIQAALTNQNSLNVNLSYNATAKDFSGTIDTTGGTNLANFELINNVPVVKFTDGYIESIF